MRPAIDVWRTASDAASLNSIKYKQAADERGAAVIEADRAALVAEIVGWLDATKKEASEVGSPDAVFWLIQIKRDIQAKWGSHEG